MHYILLWASASLFTGFCFEICDDPGLYINHPELYIKLCSGVACDYSKRSRTISNDFGLFRSIPQQFRRDLYIVRNGSEPFRTIYNRGRFLVRGAYSLARAEYIVRNRSEPFGAVYKRSQVHSSDILDAIFIYSAKIAFLPNRQRGPRP